MRYLKNGIADFRCGELWKEQCEAPSGAQHLSDWGRRYATESSRDPRAAGMKMREMHI